MKKYSYFISYKIINNNNIIAECCEIINVNKKIKSNEQLATLSKNITEKISKEKDYKIIFNNINLLDEEEIGYYVQ